MKISVSWQRFLLFTHAGLLIIALVCGRWLYAGALGRSDALYALNPYPLVTTADNIAYYPANPFPNIKPRSGHVVSNPFVYVRDWYCGLNGRISVAVINSLIAFSAKAGCPTPESFPWWLMRALSLYCLLATPLNFMVALGWAWAKRPGRALVLLAAVGAIWIVSPKIYIFTVIFDVLLTDRIAFIYMLTWMFMGVLNNWMGRSAWKWGLLAAGILFLSSEQNMFSVPILLMAAAWIGFDEKAGATRSWRWQAFYYGAWTCLSAAIFFLSPGQWIRNKFLAMKTIGNFAPFEWYRQVVMLGYGAIFPRLPDALWIWHLILYGGLGLMMAAGVIMRLKRINPSRLAAPYPRPPLFDIGLIAFAFLTAFLTSMATLLASPYFPPYAIYYPSLLLVLGLVFSFWLVLDGAAIFMDLLASSARLTSYAGIKRTIGYVKSSCLVGLPVLVTIILIGAVTIRAWPVMAAEYRQVMAQDYNRRQLYAEIVRLRNTTGRRHFVLVNLWNLPVWGIHMDEAWAIAGYFRWRRMEDVVCTAEVDWIAAGRPQEHLYFKLDCAKLLEGK
ncbi:MAG: hypothetical protein ABIH24_11525 [Verrucomicrobiota bacterium]